MKLIHDHGMGRRNEQIIDFDPISEPIVNPMMGWAPWATLKESKQPHSLVYVSLTWRDFEPREGDYDFDSFENRQQLARWRQEGKRVVFRFVADVPGDQPHKDIPDWLFDKIHGSGDYYDNEYGKGFSPDYSNLVFIEKHKEVLRALGERYGKDGFFAFIELGSLGHWGEWHTHPEIRPLPSEDIRNLYVYHYAEAFPATHLLMRRPFAIAQTLKLGLYNDMTADLNATNIWLDWIENGSTDRADEAEGLSAMPAGWQEAPIGGEQASNLSNEQVYDTNLEQTLQLLKQSHTSFIGPGSPYKVEMGGILQEGIDRVMATIGYRIYIDRVQMPRQVLYGKNLKITLTFSNSGIAPVYYNWPTRFYLFDEEGNTVATCQAEIDLRNILPGDLDEMTVRIPIDNLRNGSYSIGIAIIDPMTGKPSIKLANENTRQDLIQYIGFFEIRRLFSPS